MKIIESDEENNENRKAVEIDNLDGRDKSQGSGNTSDTKIMFGKGELSDPIGDDIPKEVEQDRVPVVTPRGRGRPRKSTLVSDSVSPLAIVSATPLRGKGRPPKDTSIIKSPLQKDSPFPSERKGRGRPKKIVDASDVVGTMVKPEESHIVDMSDLEEKDSPLPSERKGRGRPKKIVDVGTVEKVDETQNADMTDLKQKADSAPRRGRGRPKKNFGNFSASTSLIAANSTPRRGRGRPRKNFKNIGGTPLSKGRIGHQNDFKRFGAIQLLAQALAKHGRGRPRKGTGIKDAVQMLQKDPVLSKPGRGRPPKSIKRIFAMKLLAKAAGSSHRGRGRPRKVVDVPTGSTSETAPAVTPRGRGRPRKINLEAPANTLQSDKAPAVTPITPRGRGRPRKNLPTADTAVLSSKGSLSDMVIEEL